MTDHHAAARSRAGEDTAKNLGKGRRGRPWVRLVLILVAACALAGSSLWWWKSREVSASVQKYETAKVTRGDLRVTVSATGTIESVGAVDIGAETSGRVDEVYVEFNDQVKKGQPMARINTEQLQAKLKEGRAQAQVAAANVASARATLEEASVKAGRTRKLSEQGLVSDQDLDAAIATEKRANAALSTAVAQQAVSAASLEAAQSALDKATIRSPVDGVVLSREIEPGQTVASSFQSPVLFTVARDLTTMKLKVDIDEADVGSVKEGQQASFTVDAYPKREFPAVVKSLKNVPTSGKDVVTYEAELTVENSERLLRPGMTATATITTDARDGVLLVPNAALRFRPPESSMMGGPPGMIPGMGGPPPPMGGPPGGGPEGPPGGPGAGSGQGSTSTAHSRSQKSADGARLWREQGHGVAPIQVTSGSTDGVSTEVSGDGLQEGMGVVVGLVEGGS